MQVMGIVLGTVVWAAPTQLFFKCTCSFPEASTEELINS